MSQYDPFRYSNLSPQMVIDMIVGNVEQTPALMAQYDVNNDGTISATDQQIIQNNQNQMAGSGMQFADMNMPMVTPGSQQTQIQTPSQAMPINNMGQGQVQQQQQPQTIGQGQPNYGNLNVQQALDLSTGAAEMTPAFMKQYDLNQDGTVNITDVSNLITGKENIAKQNLSPYGSQVYNPQVQAQTQSMARPINNMGQGQQPQTMGQGQPNYGNLDLNQAERLIGKVDQMTPALMKQYDVNQDSAVDIDDVMKIMNQKKMQKEQNLSPYGSQVYNSQVQMATPSQAMPAQAASPAMAAAMAQQQNPFARPMEDGGIVYMKKGEDPEGVIDKLTGTVTGWAEGVKNYFDEMVPKYDSSKYGSASEQAKAQNIAAGNAMGLSPGSFIGATEYTYPIGERLLTFKVDEDYEPFKQSDAEEKRDKAYAAYKRAISAGAGEGVSQDYIRGRKDARAESFLGGSQYEDTKARAEAGADIDMSVYDNPLTSKKINNTVLVGYENEKGEFQPISYNDAQRALAAGQVDQSSDPTGDDPTGDDLTPTPTPTPTPVSQPTVVPTPSQVTSQFTPISPVPTTPFNPFERPENVPSPYASPFEASPSLYDVQQSSVAPFSSRFGDQDLSLYQNYAPFTGGQQPPPQTFEEIMAQYDPFNPLKNSQS